MCGELTQDLVAEALSTVRVQDVTTWVSENVGETMQSKRRGSLPCLRPAHHIDSKGLRSGLDRRRIPHKMLETPASHKEEPDAWILSVSKPGLNYQNSA